MWGVCVLVCLIRAALKAHTDVPHANTYYRNTPWYFTVVSAEERFLKRSTFNMVYFMNLKMGMDYYKKTDSFKKKD